MHRLNRAASSALLALALVAAPALAAPTPEAQKVLDRMAELVDEGPFEIDYAADMEMEAMGAPMGVKLGGHMTQSGLKYKRMSMDMTMTPAGDTSGGITMSVLMVADGTTVWTEMNNPMMGGQQVMKIGLDQFEKLSQSGDDMGLAQMSGMDPVSQLRQLGELFDFDVSGRADGKATLTAEITAEGLSKLGVPASTAEALTSFEMTVDEKTGFPTELKLGGAKPIMVMHFTNFKKLDEAEIPAELFSYTPPEGAQVLDLGTMLGAGGGDPE